MSGGEASIDEMITTTKSGILVTRFWGVRTVDSESALYSGYTRDGLWLIRDGKIDKSIKNFRFLDSVFSVLNNVEQLGMPARVFHPEFPVVVPPLKVREFNFVALSESI